MTAHFPSVGLTLPLTLELIFLAGTDTSPNMTADFPSVGQTLPLT